MPGPMITAPPTTVNVNSPMPPPAGGLQPQNPPVTATIPPQPTQAAPAPQQAPHPIKSAVSGWQALMGTHTEYEQTPNGPQPIQVRNTGHDLFRSILAGALMGAAAGGQTDERENAGSGWQGAARGAGAVQQNNQRQDFLAQQQAQQQFENKMKASQEAREQQAFQTEEQLRKAQIANANLETLRVNQLMQGTSFTQHQDLAAAGKAQIQPYIDAGLKPVVQDMSESDITQYMKDHPGSSSLDWEATGTKIGPDGKYENTFTAFDPKGNVTVAPATYNQWKKDGVFDRFPEYEAVLKPGKTLTAQQYIQVKRDADKVRADGLARQLDDLNVKKIQTAINADNARIAEAYSTIKKNNQEIADAAIGKTQAAQFDKALTDLNAANGDFSKLKPSSRVIIAESMNKMVPALNQELKTVLADPTDPEGQQKAGAILQQIQGITSLSSRALASIESGKAGGEIAHPEVQSILAQVPGFNPEIAQKIANLTPDQIEQQLPGANLPQDVKNKILIAVGKKPADTRSQFQKNFPATSKAIGEAANVIRTVPIVP